MEPGFETSATVLKLGHFCSIYDTPLSSINEYLANGGNIRVTSRVRTGP